MCTKHDWRKWISLFGIFFLGLQGILSAETIIQQASMDDFEKIMQFDREVSFEFFKPMYQAYYSQYDFGRNPDLYLEHELMLDRELFPDYITQINEAYCLLIAYDNVIESIVGLLLFHKEDNQEGYLDLFFVKKSHRKQGLGKKLFIAAQQYLYDVTTWVVEPFQFGNETTLQFYTSLGFINYGPVDSQELNSYGVACSQLYFHYVKRQ